MSINMVSTKQLRENFWEIKEGIERGLSYILIYRSQPLAKITPIEKKGPLYSRKADNKATEAKLRQVEKLAGGFKFGKGLTPEEINRVIEKQYEDEFDKMLS